MTCWIFSLQATTCRCIQHHRCPAVQLHHRLYSCLPPQHLLLRPRYRPPSPPHLAAAALHPSLLELSRQEPQLGQVSMASRAGGGFPGAPGVMAYACYAICLLCCDLLGLDLLPR